MTVVAITHHGTEVLESDRAELLAVYRDAYADKLDNAFFAEERHWERLEAYAKRDGFALVEGRIDGYLVGYALGYRLPANSAWWRGLLNDTDPELTREDGQRTFALNYIMVRQNYRRHGYARKLHDALLSDRTEERATLLVMPQNVAAHSAYTNWGWRIIGQLQPFPDSPIYDAMMIALR